MRLVLAHAEQLKHGVKNEQHLGSIDRRIVVHVVDVEGIAKLLFQWCFGRGDIGNEKLNKEMLTNDEHATLALPVTINQHWHRNYFSSPFKTAPISKLCRRFFGK